MTYVINYVNNIYYRVFLLLRDAVKVFETS
jgi:hypothetical protein